MDKTTITFETNIKAPNELVWDFWTKPEHMMHTVLSCKTKGSSPGKPTLLQA